jgi:hypothetical protein
MTLRDLILLGNGYLINIPNMGNGLVACELGDINGDDISDFAIGLPDYNQMRGMVLVVLGRGGDAYRTVNVSEIMESLDMGYVLYSDAINGLERGSESIAKMRCHYVVVGSASDVYAMPCGTIKSCMVGGGFSVDQWIAARSDGVHLTTKHMGPEHFEMLVMSLGDVNGDAVSDIGVSFPRASNNAGVVYVLYGFTSSSVAGPGSQSSMLELDLDKLSQSQGYTIRYSTAVVDYSISVGVSMSGAGDLNNDGVNDIVVGTNLDGSFVVFGRNGFENDGISLFEDIVASGSARGLTGVHITHTGSSSNFIGYSVSGNVDFNIDGVDDVVLGCPFDPNQRYVYVVYGSASVKNTDLRLLSDVSDDVSDEGSDEGSDDGSDDDSSNGSNSYDSSLVVSSSSSSSSNLESSVSSYNSDHATAETDARNSHPPASHLCLQRPHTPSLD